MVSAAQSLLDQGHRLGCTRDRQVAPQPAENSRCAPNEFWSGTLQSGAETKGMANQVKAIGRMDAIIHNAGVYTWRSRGSTPEGHAGALAINNSCTQLADGTDRAPR